MIKSGRTGQVKMGADVATSAIVASLNNWTLSLATERIDVTCFNDTNKKYVPGMRDISGTIGGFWDSAELKIIGATDDDVPVYLELIPNTSEATMKFSGKAYIDAEIEVPVAGAPTVKSNFGAADSWTIPAGA